MMIACFYFVLTSALLSPIDTQFHLYHTKYPTDHGDHTCLYRYTSEFDGRSRYLVPYCIRAMIDPDMEKDRPCYGQNITFQELKQTNVTAGDLMEWFVPIDLISDYEQFLVDAFEGEAFLCNCSEEDHSFGARCQYQFPANVSSFDDLIDVAFVQRTVWSDIRTFTEENDVTCYPMFNCTTHTGFCLDWRQICNNQRDCVNGQDEARCLEKELNECDEQTEYRCLSGHCIPRAFAFDLTVDCPNWDDEQSSSLFKYEEECEFSLLALAECEERSCGLAQFSCGDGHCLPKDLPYDDQDVKCITGRSDMLAKRLYTRREQLSEECWGHMICNLGLSCLYESPDVSDSSCEEEVLQGVANFCYELDPFPESCLEGEELFFPSSSIAYPFVRLIYRWQPFELYREEEINILGPSLVCYNASACDALPWNNSYQAVKVIDGYSCYDSAVVGLEEGADRAEPASHATIIFTTVQQAFSTCFAATTPLYSSLFQCTSGSQISCHRLHDRHEDCYPWYDDEVINVTCPSEFTSVDRFDCREVAIPHEKSIPRRVLHDGWKDCDLELVFTMGCTYEYDCQLFRTFDLSKPLPIVYQELCNGFNRLFYWSQVTDDEMYCDTWPCEARAQRCDGVWNRASGCDELHCPGLIPTYLSRVIANCSVNEHYCLLANESAISCLPVDKAGDGKADCLFAMDERMTRGVHAIERIVTGSEVRMQNNIVCRHAHGGLLASIIRQFCPQRVNCTFNFDDILCPWHSKSNCAAYEFSCKNQTCIEEYKRCDKKIDCWPEGEDEWTCDVLNTITWGKYNPFTLSGFDTEVRDEEEQVAQTLLLKVENVARSPRETITLTKSHTDFYCHRGLILQFKDGNDSCICPPSYYGTRCELQSQRLTVTFRLEMPPVFEHSNIYHLIFVLIDEHQKVLTIETELHMPSKQAALKHFIYLAYPRRTDQPLSAPSFLHIEAYPVTTTEVQPLSLAWHYPIQFPFLPVNRLALKLDLEPVPPNKTLCRRLQCTHGQCHSYVNTLGRHFCSCHPGWAGIACNQRLPVDPCARLNCDTIYSKCVAYDDRAVCLCALGRMGHNCRVSYNACAGIRCENGGQCVSLDQRALRSVCICSVDYFGDLCQFRTARLTIQMPRNTEFIPAMIVHFLHTPKNIPGFLSHRSNYFLRNIHPNTQITIHDTQQQFLPSIIIVQTFIDPSSYYGSYYLLSLLDHNRNSLTKMLSFANRCVHVSERLPITIMNITWIHRAKLYHYYFKDVRCFFDEFYMCLVDRQQRVDCLIYNYDVANCTDRNYCENGGRCLQNTQTGQVQFACVCPECHYGAFCQLSMAQYTLTLDSVLGQEIVTDAPLSEQKALVKLALAAIVLMFAVGIVSNILSAFTFSHLTIRQFGCGCYLLILSIASQISLLIFVGRFIFLLISQMTIITDIRFLKISCTIFDLLLQLSVAFCDWLTACVNCERMFNAIKGVAFNKLLSVRMVKFVIPTLLVSLILVSIHQAYIRELIPDPRLDERLWCVIKFPQAWLQRYHTIMSLLASIVPFLFNLISAVVLLIVFSRTRQKAGAKKYFTILTEQTKAHKDLLVSPVLIIIFKLPMILITLIIKCVKYRWQLYLSVAAYFVALMPLTLTFLLFILPSQSYRRIFTHKRAKLFARMRERLSEIRS